MCGRYVHFSQKEEFEDHFELQSDNEELFLPNYNVCPATINPVVLQPRPDKIGIGSLKWGLVPDWAEKPDIGYKMINARTESVFEKQSFKKSIESRRCLIPANGFYEWKQMDKSSKQCFYLYHPQVSLFSFAGIFSVWKDRRNSSILWTYSILTRASRGNLEYVHERMPVIIEKADYQTWLNPITQSQQSIQSFFESPISDELMYFPVTNEVGKTSANFPELINPLT